MGALDTFKDILRLKKLRKEWRNLNPHNGTWINKIFDIHKVKVGKHSYGPLKVYSWGSEEEKLIIGNYVSIADDVKFILGGNHRYDTFTSFPFKVRFGLEGSEEYTNGSIVVEDDVWFGTSSMVMSGITIGKGAVIAAGSVVTKNVPPYAIVGGNPAKVIKYRFSEEIINKLKDINLADIKEEKIAENIDLMYTSVDEETANKLKNLWGK